jgi:hypothetical protein
MKKRRKYPRNLECPLTKEEKKELSKALDELEWRAYVPLKHLTGGWSEAKVIEYDEFKVEVKVEWGVDGEGWNDFDYQTIEREDLITVKKN